MMWDWSDTCEGGIYGDFVMSVLVVVMQGNSNYLGFIAQTLQIIARTNIYVSGAMTYNMCAP